MRKIFLNATQHKLTEGQIEAIKKLDAEIQELADVDPELFSKLKNTPADENEIYVLAGKFINLVRKLSQEYHRLYLHLPIGSPAFMFKFSKYDLPVNVIPVFSHTDRISYLRDGVKVSEFRFKKFLMLM